MSLTASSISGRITTRAPSESMTELEFMVLWSAFVTKIPISTSSISLPYNSLLSEDSSNIPT